MMKKITAMGLTVLLGAGVAMANPHPAAGGGRDAFMKQQALIEVQRLGGQLDVLESNQNALAERVRRLEGGGGEVATLKAEVDALRSDIARLRAEMRNQRAEIVNDIVGRIQAEERKRARQAPPAPQPQPPAEARGTYTVQPGDTLSLIAQAFGTTVGRLKEINNLRGDNLRVGQKLSVPEPGAGKRR